MLNVFRPGHKDWGINVKLKSWNHGNTVLVPNQHDNDENVVIELSVKTVSCHWNHCYQEFILFCHLIHNLPDTDILPVEKV